MFNDSFLMIHFCRASNWECEILPLLKYTKPNSTIHNKDKANDETVMAKRVQVYLCVSTGMPAIQNTLKELLFGSSDCAYRVDENDERFIYVYEKADKTYTYCCKERERGSPIVSMKTMRSEP